MTSVKAEETTTLAESIKRGDSETLTDQLDRAPELLHAQLDGALSPLMLAVYHGQGRIVEELINRGVPVDVFAAAALGDVIRLREILHADPAGITTVSVDGWTALHLAAHFGHTEVARLLLEAGASVHAHSTNGMSNVPLHAALAGNHVEVAELLLNSGADVDALQHGGFTGMHEAAQNGNMRMVELLLSRGADTTVLTDDGRTAAGLAREGGHTELAELLEQTATQRP